MDKERTDVHDRSPYEGDAGEPSRGAELLEHVVGGGFEDSISNDEDHQSNKVLLVRHVCHLHERVPRDTVQQLRVSLRSKVCLVLNGGVGN